MISVLCNPGLRMRHWDQMSIIAKFDFSPDSSTTLRKMLRLNLIPYMDQFEIISGSATKVLVFLKIIFIIYCSLTFSDHIRTLKFSFLFC